MATNKKSKSDLAKKIAIIGLATSIINLIVAIINAIVKLIN